MTKVALSGGFYKAKSLLAGAQRQLNLFVESNQKDAPYPFTYYLTPGLRKLAQADGGVWRCLYLAGVGGFYGVCGPNVYSIDGAWNLTKIGEIGTSRGMVSMSDNRIAIVIVDGSPNGYVITPFTNDFAQISAGNGAFYGGSRVRYVDTFFVLNRPGTNQWYASLSEVSPAMLTGGPVVNGSIAGGSGYTNGLHVGIDLTGGTGSGVQAEVTVAGGIVTAVAIDVAGDNYRVGDVLSATGAVLGGGVSTGTTVGGTGYANATYTNVPLTGGSGTGALATIVVALGIAGAPTITSAGSGYHVGDVLSAAAASLGGTGSGFTFTLTAVTSGGAGFTYTLTDVGSSAFDPLDIAAKTGASDDIVTLEVLHRDVWLFGARFSTEIWYNAGLSDFTFARMPGVYVEHGCAALNSVACTDLFVFWIGKDKEGNAIAYVGADYTAKRISTFAVENAWNNYSTIADAIGFVYQKEGHTFWVVSFPAADKTWVYDLAEGENGWAERAWCDDDGTEHRIRPNCGAFAFGTIVVGDWENGALYALDPTVFTDDGQPIIRRRGFPHLVAGGSRVSYKRAILEMQSGQAPGLSTDEPPQVSLRYSDTRGASWGNPIIQSVGSTGQYLTSIQFRRLGLGRDRVFEVFWDFPYDTALTGAYVEAEPLGT